VILNIASDLSVLAPNQSIYKINGKHPQEQPVKPVTYSVIKAGLVGLTKYLATYWPDKNIRCNALSPGGIFNNQNQDFLNKVQELIPLNRMARVDEYNSAIQFLCSDASSYMNGQNIIIDGGRSVW
jgi:NAD(P)-dependent dehydrogenase (short-subunit alcohol dehydrogenase family)